MPDWLAVILLGIIEGVTEFLPVSSTGHLLIAERWLGHQSELFNVVVQCGAVLAVLLVFARRAKQLATQWREPATRDYLFKLVMAFGITAAGGLILKRLGLSLPKTAAPVAWATLIGGGVILMVEWMLRRQKLRDELGWTVAIAAGCAQLVALAFPGTSRAGATILVALAFGVTRPAATEFSFLLGIPTLLSAGGYEIMSAFRHNTAAGELWGMVALGTAVAAVTAFAVVKWLLCFVQTHTFIAFGWYRIGLGLLILILSLA